ncbi:coiled-coil domain-containing protein 171-like [Biomphalaria glabrata]|uniref:Coiled-coil domain-containing protein 171-like n=1 Tax=Biomphalaria glabrata TaxID=6526 RepID=A0A9W2ZG37_BIOGL|nr:coiled-coil domain-containing protein 171-like [Biomphalaria glabrata]XP_055873968.1 coiled-coil domain-containing protein 171-like [Biomphalaria glabrata]XP_055873969.1 coiled-coil domain-containing protein 171-like [Biomphalaria glabrata]
MSDKENLSFTSEDDVNTSHFINEMNRLRLHNQQLQVDLETEHDTVKKLKKKLNSLEKHKLESTSKNNNELASLETQLAKVRAEVEKGEAIRQNLEYELTKSQRELSHIKQATQERESVLMEGTDDLKQKITELTNEVKLLKQSLQNIQESSEERESKLKNQIEDGNNKLSQAMADLESVRREKLKMSELCQQHSSLITELNENLHEFETDKRNVLESLRRATAEIEYAKDNDARLRIELENAFTRIKTLEENIEMERSSHLETKFNSEIVQLRVRDLESALEVEKSANFEANKAIERLSQQSRELEQVYEEERKIKKEIVHKLEKSEKEHLSAKKQLVSEIEDKKAAINNLSRELEIHQKNFNELKSELGKTKKRQMFLEETYEGSIKELEFLSQTFHFDDKKLRMSQKEEVTNDSKGKKVTNPCIVVDNFKQLLIQVKKKMDSQTDEINKIKKSLEKLSKELAASKELIKAKEKSIEENQQRLSKTTKDLKKSRSNYADLEATIGKLKTSLQVNANNQDKNKSRIQELSEEIMKLVKRHRTEEEEKLSFLHGLYQRLHSCHLVEVLPDKKFNQFAFEDLKDIIYEQVALVIDTLQITEEKLKSCLVSNQEKQDLLSELKQSHHDQISRLMTSASEREQAWSRQKEELEQHYNQMINDLQSRTLKTQAIADQAWEKVRATGNVQQGLESEVSELRQEIKECQASNSSLLSACALLVGAFYPLYTRASMLSAERRILDEMYTSWENCREQGIYLNTVLGSGKDFKQNKPLMKGKKFQSKKSPILRFRVFVLSVIAANRLVYFSKESPSCFYTYSSNIGYAGLTVKVGGQTKKYTKFSGVLNFKESDSTFDSETAEDERNTLSFWLKSPVLQQTILNCMSELQDVMFDNKKEIKHPESSVLVAAAKSSLSKLIDRLYNLFPSPTHPTQTSLRDRTSLVRKLEKHLSHILGETPEHLKGNLISSQEIMSNLQNHILDLTLRLHNAEKERRHYLAELNELKDQIGDESSEQYSEEKKSASKNAKYVPMSKFEQVCLELSSALRREQKAQSLLQEQSKQLTELTSQLDLCTSDLMEKQKLLVQAQEALSETQKELRHKEQSLRQMNRLMSQFEYEKDSLQSNLKDAESALRSSFRDKEILAQYIKNVELILENAKKQNLVINTSKSGEGEMTLACLLLDAQLIPQDIGRTGPELIAIQNLVGSFVDAQNQAINKIRALQTEITSHRDHISILKQELNNAVNREFHQKIGEIKEFETSTTITDSQDLASTSLRPSSGVLFDTSQSKTHLISPPLLQNTKSAFHTVKSKNMQTSKEFSNHK